MKSIVLVVFAFLSLGAIGQEWSAEDSIRGQQMIETIEQSLRMYYAEQSPNGNYDSVIEVLEFESSDVPSYSDEVYCDRLSKMNEMSPFHLECNESTLRTIKFFAEKRRGFVRIVLGRSKLYFDMFEEKLAKHGLPIELKYLAVIESGLRPQVKSRAGALGLWQFMYATGRWMGLQENSYIDERMDPDKATEAACEYLKMLFGMYNDWNLALAAYNAGPGNVNKAIRRSGNKLTYWEVRPFLPTETQGYVPNFIAAAYLMTYYAEHNIIPAEATITYNELDTMCVQKGVHMSTISKLLEYDEQQILELNPIYKKSYIPKSDPAQCIMLPLDKIGELVTLEDSLYALEFNTYIKTSQPDITPAIVEVSPTTTTEFAYHKVKTGETLGTVASKYGTTVHQLQQINGLNSTKIYVGQRLKVKAGTEVDSTSPSPTPTPQVTVAKTYYTVRSGDTFGKIAQRHKLSTSQLQKLNPSINVNRLSIGQKIRVK